MWAIPGRNLQAKRDGATLSNLDERAVGWADSASHQQFGANVRQATERALHWLGGLEEPTQTDKQPLSQGASSCSASFVKLKKNLP